MILGSICSRDCPFCAVRTGRPEPVDPEEPWRVAEAVRRMELRHAVVTSVTRDDLPDGGAGQFAHTIEAIRAAASGATVEVLASDFNGGPEAVDMVLSAAPDVFGHNIETVARLYPAVRDPKADYTRSLSVLGRAAAFRPRPIVKSAFMVGHGETRAGVEAALNDLARAGCVAVSIGQYLQPSGAHRPVQAFVRPETFDEYAEMARALGFRFVASGPLVRSSYWADKMIDVLQTSVSTTSAGEGNVCGTK